MHFEDAFALRQYYLKRVGLLVYWYFYLTVIRPVLEYRCATWHHGLTVAQSQKLEYLQKRALRIIHSIAYDMPYDSACAYAGVEPLSVRRCDLGRKFFSHSYKCWRLFTRPSSPTTRLRYYFSTPTTYRLSHTTDENWQISVFYLLCPGQEI